MGRRSAKVKPALPAMTGHPTMTVRRGCDCIQNRAGSGLSRPRQAGIGGDKRAEVGNHSQASSIRRAGRTAATESVRMQQRPCGAGVR
ncbi:MAG: hypothetical protein JWM68_4673 [Verrucomicrobiales bacterium]|nr:hypothetical protein [Verrucomicrobiales bacterium]